MAANFAITLLPSSEEVISRCWEEELDGIDERFKLVVRDRTLGAGAQKAAQQLLMIEDLGRPVPLDDDKRSLPNALVSGEAKTAREAFAPAPDGGSVFGGARIDHLGVGKAAGRATHGIPFFRYQDHNIERKARHQGKVPRWRARCRQRSPDDTRKIANDD